MILERIMEWILPTIIAFCELVGVLVITISVIYAFVKYLKWLFAHEKNRYQYKLARGLAAGLEFKMAAEILKTVLVHDLEELLILGAVILLRAFLSVLIHSEMKHEKSDSE